MTVECPLDCPYLRDARQYERVPLPDPLKTPNQEIQVDENFLVRNELLLVAISGSLAGEALCAPAAVDRDVKDALDSLVRTYRALQSGLIYEVRPDNPVAARLQSSVQEIVRLVREDLAKADQNVRDSDVLGVLAFLQRMEIHTNNGRPKGRAFIDFLRALAPFEEEDSPEEDSESGLILMP